jgi:hypothetical protein
MDFSDSDADPEVPTLDDAPPIHPSDDDIEDAETEVITTGHRRVGQADEDAETEVITTEPRSMVGDVDDQVHFDLEEDDTPLIGYDLSIPPADDDDDDVQAPQEVAASLHAAPPSDEPPAQLEAVTDDNLVMFDERPDEEVPLADLEVQDSATDAQFDDTEAPEDQETLAPEDAPPGFDAIDAPKLRGGTPEPAPTRPARPAPGFEEESNDPPTEDQPSHLPEDLASLYQAPMNVPEPPPIPGILDRYTPAPARHTEGRRPSSAGPAQDRSGFVPTQPASAAAPPSLQAPTGMWDETPIAKDTPPPVPAVHKPPPPPETPIWQDPWFITVVGIAGLAALIVVVAGLLWWNSNSGSQDRVVQPVTVTPVMPASERPPADPDADSGDGSPSLAIPDQVEPDAPLPTTTKPRVRRPAEPTTDPVARTGRLKIRSTRQVLVSINGQPVGMTPLDLDKPAGRYVVTANVDGRQVEQRVDLTVGTIRLIEL